MEDIDVRRQIIVWVIVVDLVVDARDLQMGDVVELLKVMKERTLGVLVGKVALHELVLELLEEW